MFIILTLLSVVNCKIYVQIMPETKDDNVSVTAYGSETALMTDLEQRSFSLQPKEVSCRLSRAGIYPPNYVHIRGTSHYGYRDIYTTLRPSSAKITNSEWKTVVMFRKELINNSSVAVTFKTGIKEAIFERMSVKWAPNSYLSLGKEVEIDFSQRLRHTYVDKEKEIEARTMTTNSDVELTLQPGQNAIITMLAVRVRLDVTMVYAATLSGDLYCQYTVFTIPISGRAIDVNDYFKMAHTPGVITATQYIYLDYYSSGRVVVRDGGGAIFTKPIQID